MRQDTRGFVSLIPDKSRDGIVSAQVLAEEGGELITEASLAVRYGAKAQDMATMFHPYLTWNEAWKLAALGFNKDVKTLSCSRNIVSTLKCHQYSFQSLKREGERQTMSPSIIRNPCFSLIFFYTRPPRAHGRELACTGSISCIDLYSDRETYRR